MEVSMVRRWCGSSRIHGAQPLERTNHQRRADQKNQRQGDFANHQNVARQTLAPPRAGSPAALLEAGGQIGVRSMQGRQQTEENAGDQAMPMVNAATRQSSGGTTGETRRRR